MKNDAPSTSQERQTDPAKTEIEKLDWLARFVFIYLSLLAVAGLFGGYRLLTLHGPESMTYLLAVALIGLSGSSIAALSSSLERYATGYEISSGKKMPEALNEEKNQGKETFNARMTGWFFVRPFLGFVIAPVFLWGLVFLVKDSNSWREHAGFTAFVGGLLAKSVVDLIKNLFKNVFHN
jgi:hypothetical protein